MYVGVIGGLVIGGFRCLWVSMLVILVLRVVCGLVGFWVWVWNLFVILVVAHYGALLGLFCCGFGDCYYLIRSFTPFVIALTFV